MLLEAARRRKIEAMQRTAVLYEAVYNYGGLRDKKFLPKKAHQLFPGLFGEEGACTITSEELAEMDRRHQERLKREQAAHG